MAQPTFKPAAGTFLYKYLRDPELLLPFMADPSKEMTPEFFLEKQRTEDMYLNEEQVKPEYIQYFERELDRVLAVLSKDPDYNTTNHTFRIRAIPVLESSKPMKGPKRMKKNGQPYEKPTTVKEMIAAQEARMNYQRWETSQRLGPQKRN